MMVKSGLEFILKFTEPLQRYLLSCQANLAILGRYFCTGQQQVWRGSVNFKINSRPLFTIIFKLKNDNSKTRDFNPPIERVLNGVTVQYCYSILHRKTVLENQFLKNGWNSAFSKLWSLPYTFKAKRFCCNFSLFIKHSCQVGSNYGKWVALFCIFQQGKLQIRIHALRSRMLPLQLAMQF